MGGLVRIVGSFASVSADRNLYTNDGDKKNAGHDRIVTEPGKPRQSIGRSRLFPF